MRSRETFEIILPKDRYVVGFDPYDETSTSYSLGVMTKPKQKFGIKKIRGFRRVVSIGWSYVVELIK